MEFETPDQAEDFIFSSYMRVEAQLTGLPDSQTRLPVLTRRLLDRLGRPDQHFTPILVTGSKGKGSISLMTAKLLESLGHRVGLVTSPHILDFRERIRFNGQAIPPADFVALANQLADPAREIMAELSGRQYFSPTGLILALAALYFAQNRVDFAVIEAGRGGRMDDCAVLDNPLALFGPVLREHPAQLGQTVAEIAAQKTVLLRGGGVGVSVPQSLEVEDVMYGWAGQVGGQLLTVGRDIEIRDPRIEGDRLRLSVKGRVNTFEDLSLPIPALYEADNLAVALAAVEIASDDRHFAPDKLEGLRQAVSHIRWPGRMQFVSDDPLTLLDCSVTRQSTRSVLDSLGDRLQHPVTAIVGVPSDRDWRGVLDELAGRCDTVILTRLGPDSRLHFPEEAGEYALRRFPLPATRLLEASDFGVAQVLLNRYPTRTVLILGTQSVIAQALRNFNLNLEKL